jgi:pSer/pThr/pTyr-binding forkhead associated (FHA) protein
MKDSSSGLRLVVASDKHQDEALGPRFAHQEFRLDRSRLTIGRRPYNDIAIEHPTVSGEHALLERRGADFELIDTGSSNGCFVNGLRVTRKKLRAGDYLAIGAFQLRLVSDAQPTPTALLEREPLAGTAGAQVEYLNGPLKGIKQPVTRTLLKIGRGAEVAVVARRREGYFLTHLEGLKPSMLNGEPVSVGSRILSSGDLIQLGDTQVRFSALEIEPSPG